MSRPTLLRAALRLALLGALLPGRLARAQEYRAVTLADGREVVGEVLATESEGIRLQLPQGELLVPFVDLSDMVPSDANRYANQRRWEVWVAPGPEQRRVAEAFDALEAVGALRPSAPPAGCSTADLDCLVPALQPEKGWRWVVVHRRIGEEIELEAGVGATRRSARLPAAGEAGVALAVLLGLEPPPVQITQPVPAPAPPPPVEVEPPPSTPEVFAWSEARISRVSLVPVPGLPSFAQGRSGEGVAAIATSMGLGGMWIHASGRSAQTLPAQIGLAAVGCYGSMVLSNQLFGLRSARALALRPLSGEAPGVALQGSL